MTETNEEKQEWGMDAPTEKQINFLAKLHNLARESDIDSSRVTSEPKTKKEASKAIDALVKMLDMAIPDTRKKHMSSNFGSGRGKSKGGKNNVEVKAKRPVGRPRKSK